MYSKIKPIQHYASAGIILLLILTAALENMVEYTISSRKIATETLFEIDKQFNRMKNKILSDHNDHWKRIDRPKQINICRQEASLANTRYAIVSMLNVDSAHFHIQSAVKLAKSARLWFPTDHMDMIMMTIEDLAITVKDHASLAKNNLLLKKAGWNIICSTPQIERPKMISRLHVNAFAEYEAILFLDTDTLIIREPTQLFMHHLPGMIKEGFSLAAVRPAKLSNVFNPGVVLMIPGNEGDQILRKLTLRTANVIHGEDQTDQGILNARNRFYELPHIYNANVVSKKEEPDLWNENKHNISILHFTVSKGWQSFRHFNTNLNNFCCWFWNIDDLCQLWDFF